eukprot:g7417.t1 g7417   contig24:568969-569730(+)
MVEIIPYIEDDEDTSTWIPLTAPSTNAATTATAANTTEPSDKANVDECDTQNSYAVLKGVEPIQEGNGEAVQSNIHTIVENVNSSDDDDQDWEKLPSQSSQAHQSESIKSTSAAPVAETWSLTKQIISHLTTASSSHTDPSAIDEDASTGEENIAWSRPNQIDDGESFDRWNETRGRRINVEEECDDDVRRTPLVHTNSKQKSQHQVFLRISSHNNIIDLKVLPTISTRRDLAQIKTNNATTEHNTAKQPRTN